VSYEGFMGLSLMERVMLAGSFNLREIGRSAKRHVVLHPAVLGLVIFLIAGVAETHRCRRSA